MKLWNLFTHPDNKALRLALDATEQQLANLTQNIPGGAHQCAGDSELTLLSMSDGFLKMVGYTREEIGTLFQNKLINLVYPGDRGALMKSIGTQFKEEAEAELEYRVLRKYQEPIWVLDRCRKMTDEQGGLSYYCLLVDITKRKQEQEALRLSLERHKVIMDQAADIIFEWDIVNDTLIFSSNWRKKFGYDAIDSNISDRIPLSSNIHKEDMQAFLKIMHDTSKGLPYSETEFRIKNSKNRYFWCRIRATTQYDSDAHPIKAVGVIVDIDEEKRQKQKLLDQAQRDALTGLYNKTTLLTLAEQRMLNKGGPGYQTLMIIDVDHFKAVNDTYGHLAGDSVLSDIAAALRKGTRAADLVGRIGGDEFLVYLPEVTDETAARQKAAQLLEAFRHITPKPGTPPITCSIGAAFFPRGSIDYYALYKCADQALYQQKSNGRNGAAFFGSDTNSNDFPCGFSPTAVGNDITSDEENVADEGLAQYVFRTLYTAKDTSATIIRLLEIIGRSFDVSRVYIFESSGDGRSCSNTFEWCNENVTPQIDELQNIAYVDELGDYLTNFDKDGMFYCHDIESLHPDVYEILKPQGIYSMLQCAVLDEGDFAGYVGFDECRENKTWNSNQVASFKLTADVLSVFLIRMRQKQKLSSYLYSGADFQA